MREEMLKQADEWLYSMKCLLSVKTDEEDRAYTQKRIDLFNWLIEQAEQNKRYREALEKIRKDQEVHGSVFVSTSYRIARKALEELE